MRVRNASSSIYLDIIDAHNLSLMSINSNFDKVLAEYKNDLANLLSENLGVDVRGKTHAYQKPYPTSFDSVSYPTGFRLPEFVKFSGEDSKCTFEHISQYLAQLGKLVL